MEILNCTIQELDAVSVVMERSFQFRPLSDFICSRAGQQQGLMLPIYRAVLAVSIPNYDVIAIGEPVHAVAIWEGPDAPVIPDELWQESGLDDALQTIGDGAADRFGALLEHLAAVQSRLRPRRSWYLVGIGVLPEFQGLGVGRALLDWGVKKADKDAVPIYLETNELRNVAFYERAGCRVVEFEEFGEWQFPIWHMCSGGRGSED